MAKKFYAKSNVIFKGAVDPKPIGAFDLRRWLSWELNALNVPYLDECCPDSSDSPGSVRFANGQLERFDGTAWVAADDTVMSIQTGLTAHAGGGQGSAVALTPGYNEITVSATTGDSVKLPTAATGLTVLVKNDGATAIDVFPFLADTINDGSANAAVRVAPGSTVQFNAISTTNWEADNQIVAAGDGAVALPALTFSTQPNMGFYKVGAAELGVAVSGAQVASFNNVGIATDEIDEKTAAAGVVVDSVLLKDGGVGNISGSQIAGFFPTIAAQGLSGAGAVNVTAYLTKYTSTGGAQALTLASGTQIGQRKKVSHVVDGGSGVLTATYVGGTTITFTTVGEFADLMWTGAAWAVLELGNTATPGTPPALA